MCWSSFAKATVSTFFVILPSLSDSVVGSVIIFTGQSLWFYNHFGPFHQSAVIFWGLQCLMQILISRHVSPRFYIVCLLRCAQIIYNWFFLWWSYGVVVTFSMISADNCSFMMFLYALNFLGSFVILLTKLLSLAIPPALLLSRDGCPTFQSNSVS